jgi:hypothetical protein
MLAMHKIKFQIESSSGLFLSQDTETNKEVMENGKSM